MMWVQSASGRWRVPRLLEHKYCFTADLLNVHFLHFLRYSIKALYLTLRNSCWKGAKAFSPTLFFPP